MPAGAARYRVVGQTPKGHNIPISPSLLARVGTGLSPSHDDARQPNRSDRQVHRAVTSR